MADPALWPAGFVLIALVLVALCVGSFLNVVIHRLPLMLEARWAQAAAETDSSERPATRTAITLSRPRSRCPGCDRAIRPWHNIPLLGYLILRGRCADCGQAISWRYPAVELASALAALVVFYRFGATPAGLAALVFTWFLLALAVIDWRTQILPDVMTLSLLWLGLIASLFDGRLTPVPPTDAIIGAAAGYGLFWLIFQGFVLLTGREGMGYGDFKLVAAIGAWLGWQQLPLVVLAASLGGSVFGVLAMASGRMNRGTPMPFGPWLAGAGWLALLAGDTIASAYLSVSGLR